jgi:hypothetical protein
MATTAVSSANVVVVDSGVDSRCAVYSRYSNGPRILSWGTLALTGENCVYSVSTP